MTNTHTPTAARRK